MNNYSSDLLSKQQTTSSHTNSILSQANAAIQEKEFLIQYTVVESTYIRLSQINKTKFLVQCIEQIDSLDVITNILSHCTTTKKLHSNYYKEGLTNFLNDNALDDHDRSMDPKMVVKAMEDGVSWYKTLPESQKLSVLVNFTKLSGGRTTIRCFHTVLEKYNSLMYKNAKDNFMQYVDQKRSISSRDQLNSSIHEEYDESNPKTLSVTKLRDNWEEKINKYRKDIDAKSDLMRKSMLDQASSYMPKKLIESKSKGSAYDFKKKEGGASKNYSIGDRKSLGGTSSKNNTIEVNYIHLLPIWLILKIFTYLDAKNLKNAQDVDSHWDFAVKTLVEERKTRIKLNSLQKTLDMNIDNDCLEENKGVDVVPESFYVYTYAELKTHESMKRGAANKKILRKRKHYKTNTEPPLFLKCLQNMVDCFNLPIQNIETFPRFATKLVPPLYKLPLNNQKDMDVNFSENIQTQVQPDYKNQEEKHSTTDRLKDLLKSFSANSYSTTTSITESNP